MGQQGAILHQPQLSFSLRGAGGLAPSPSHRGSSAAGCASQWLAASSPDPLGLSGTENIIMNSETCTTRVSHFHQRMAVQLTSHLCGKLTFHTSPTTAPNLRNAVSLSQGWSLWFGLPHNTLTAARRPRFGLPHNTLTAARTPRLGLRHNSLTPARTPRLGLRHNTLTPARTPKLH